MISREVQHEKLSFVTVSDTGAGHQKLHMPNQDAVDFDWAEEDFVMAVSDGVGSCKNAGEGSRYVVESVKKIFCDVKSGELQLNNHDIAEALISYWKEAIGDGLMDEYCATVKAVIKVGDIAKIVSVGDGIAIVNSNGKVLVSPKDEVGFTNETRCMSSFVTPKDVWIGDAHIDMNAPYTVFCCTDGVANGLVEETEIELVREIEQYKNTNDLKMDLENLINELCGYSYDDKTVGVVKYEYKS